MKTTIPEHPFLSDKKSKFIVTGTLKKSHDKFYTDVSGEKLLIFISKPKFAEYEIIE